MNYYRLFPNQFFKGFFIRSLHNDWEYPNYDKYRKNGCMNPRESARISDSSRKLQSALVLLATNTAILVGAKWSLWHFLSSMSASADVLALANIEIKTADIPVDECKVYKWRGKPLFIWHRTPEMIEREKQLNLSILVDPEPDDVRCPYPEWLVLIGVCTHLGCVPIHHQGDFFGFYCPCHGSHFDGAGRARKGPAPLNLKVPPYIIKDDIIKVG